MEILCAALLGFVIDLILGDPQGWPHPVVLMGKIIVYLERQLRKTFPETDRGLLLAGGFLAALMTLGTFAVSSLILFLLGRIHPGVRFLAEIIWSWQVLAIRDLAKESDVVRQVLQNGSLPEARKAVSRIVGRDTQALSEEGVTRAAVETIAENFSDGVAAPLFYLMIGGAPLALTYKAINTMDSMIGYKNEKYLYFGRCAARLDDAAGFLPSRIAALLLILSAYFCREDWKNAFRIFKRDRLKHASPNSAQTESVAAGALRVQLAGPANYFGKMVNKPFLGDPLRKISPADIQRMNCMMVCGSVESLFLFGAVRFLFCFGG